MKMINRLKSQWEKTLGYFKKRVGLGTKRVYGKSPKEFELSIALPELDKQDINLEVKDNCLIVSGSKTYKNELSSCGWNRKAYGYASFRRVFLLPDHVDLNKIEANFRDGILHIQTDVKIGYENNIKRIAVNYK